MKDKETNEPKKKDYTNLLLGFGGVVLIFSHIACYVAGYMTSWNICNNQMSMKEAEYIKRGYLTQDQIKEVFKECFPHG